MTGVPMPQAWSNLQAKKKAARKLAVNPARNRATVNRTRIMLRQGMTRLIVLGTPAPVVRDNDSLAKRANIKRPRLCMWNQLFVLDYRLIQGK